MYSDIAYTELNTVFFQFPYSKFFVLCQFGSVSERFLEKLCNNNNCLYLYLLQLYNIVKIFNFCVSDSISEQLQFL